MNRGGSLRKKGWLFFFDFYMLAPWILLPLPTSWTGIGSIR